MKSTALVLLSGGLDSTTALYWSIKKYSYVAAVSFNYGSKHNSAEIKGAKYVTKQTCTNHNIFDVRKIFANFNSSLLSNSGEQIPEGMYSDESMKSTVVPFRNGILLAIAAGYAESRGIGDIILGSHLGDVSIYPDCRKEFNVAMSKAIKLGTYKKIKFIAPFEQMRKEDIVKYGLKIDVPYATTYSCYNGKTRPCLKCGTCTERTEAFYLNNVKDPLLTDAEWNIAVEYWRKFNNAKVSKSASK